MINTIKTKLIAIGSLILAMLTLGGYARHQKNKRNEAERRNEQLKQVNQGLEVTISDYDERRKQEGIAARMDDDDLNQWLSDNNNLRD